ncbi:hypothetical protein M2336_002809 [Sphingobium sp. B1D7B]|uniref:hypothetical protein n=1 Tax=Sphingobium sp. B1D7B TaxID=2940578 RepID=UPI0022252822|nr:hypothetical protein [Sphingobium sp. B1D7B]MCW2406180.1 hypothetical protein [Sphingobium sp. B1D7B]
MTIVTSTAASAALRYTPEWLKQEEKPPVFLLRAGNVLERELMEAELASEHLAGTVWPWELEDACVTGLRELGGEGSEELILLAQTAHSGETISDRDQAVLSEALALLALHWPPYKLLLAQQQRRSQMIPIVAFRRFCIGWENIATPFKRGIDRLVELDSLAGIPSTTLRAAGAQAWRLQHGAVERKNSDAPSKSADDPATSNSGADTPADGSSTDSITPKTPD